jgi:hypothetical protein
VQSYVIHVSHAGDGYRATVSSDRAQGSPSTSRWTREGPAATRRASTVPGAILAAVIQAQLPALHVRRQHYGV